MVFEERILEKLTTIEETVAKIDKRTEVMEERVGTVEKLADKHEKVIYGDPEIMGKGGLMDAVNVAGNKAEGACKRIDGMKGTVLWIWTAVFAIIQAAIAIVGLARKS